MLLLLFCLLGLYLSLPCVYGSLLGLNRHQAGVKNFSPAVINELQHLLSWSAACVPPMGFLGLQLLIRRRCPATRLSKLDSPGIVGGLLRYKWAGKSISQAASENSTPDVSPQSESGVSQELSYDLCAEEAKPGDLSEILETFSSSNQKQQKAVPFRSSVSDWHARREKQQMVRFYYKRHTIPY